MCSKLVKKIKPQKFPFLTKFLRSEASTKLATASSWSTGSNLKTLSVQIQLPCAPLAGMVKDAGNTHFRLIVTKHHSEHKHWKWGANQYTRYLHSVVANFCHCTRRSPAEFEELMPDGWQPNSLRGNRPAARMHDGAATIPNSI